MKIQFELAQESHSRHFTTIIKELMHRGHRVITTACTKDCPALVERKVASGDHRKLMAFQAHIRNDEWGPLSYLLRASRDYLRYLTPEHVQSMIIRDRIRNMLDSGLQEVDSEMGAEFRKVLDKFSSDSNALSSIDKILEGIEQLIPPHPLMMNYLKNIAADVFCVTPLIVTQYGQADLIKAAKAIGIPTVFLVGSWDNLTTKGTVHVQPDSTLVWNEIQRQEASVFHNIPSEKVKVVGAARFDEFWDRSIEEDRDFYCHQFQFDPSRPIITYLGSSNLVSGDERPFVLKWINALRGSPSPLVATANILIRPHPKFSKGWREYFLNIDGVAVNISKVPTVKALNNDRDLYHCLAHSRAVVGANTSAELEAAILGRPVFTIIDKELKTGQEGTIHFAYLAGQLAKIGLTMDEHILHLQEELSLPDDCNRNHVFLENFLRPGGLDRRACEITANAIECASSSFQRQGASEFKSLVGSPVWKDGWAARLFQRLLP
ncbi:MAG: hypothetical protein AB7T38_03120 [Nitrospirales bacterium]